jgi:hypothetical protein
MSLVSRYADVSVLRYVGIAMRQWAPTFQQKRGAATGPDPTNRGCARGDFPHEAPRCFGPARHLACVRRHGRQPLRQRRFRDVIDAIPAVNRPRGCAQPSSTQCPSRPLPRSARNGTGRTCIVPRGEKSGRGEMACPPQRRQDTNPGQSSSSMQRFRHISGVGEVPTLSLLRPKWSPRLVVLASRNGGQGTRRPCEAPRLWYPETRFMSADRGDR